MTGHKPSIYWRITCCYVAPSILLVLYVFSFIQFDSKEFTSFGDRKTVIRVSYAGWIMSTISTLPIPLYAIWWFIYRRKRNPTTETTTTTGAAVAVVEKIPMNITDEQEPFI
ncbi:unnamed protein product [Rotaria socialis]|nr:unnamed protein product [Rotaria socialis]